MTTPTPAPRWLRCLACLALLLAPACTSAAQNPPPGLDDGKQYVPAATWRTTTPDSAGISAPAIQSVLDRAGAGQYGATDGVLVVRYGYLVAERYFGWNPEQPHTMQSVTKSVTSLLFGILQARHPATTSLDRNVLDVFSRYNAVANVDANKRALTMRHLLTMRTSMDFWEQPYDGSPLDQMNRSTGDWVQFILDRSMTGAPGNSWAYNSGAAILVGAAIREIDGRNADAFARQELFAPIGVSNESWYKSPFDGLPHTGGGLNLRPSDLARIGYLVLRQGRWGSAQVVPAAWVTASTQSITSGSPVFFSNYHSGYGEFWWLFPRVRGGSDKEVIAASGSGGQWLFVVPQLDLVVAIVASNGNGLDLFYDLLETLH